MYIGIHSLIKFMLIEPPKGEDDMEMDKFIRMKQVSEIVGIAQSTIYQWQREGKHAFPRPVKIGGKTSLYRLSDIQGWMNSHSSDMNENQDIHQSHSNA